jgi:hypothetical protein
VPTKVSAPPEDKHSRAAALGRLLDTGAGPSRGDGTGALGALDDYQVRAEDDELTQRLAERGAERFAELLRRLGE